MCGVGLVAVFALSILVKLAVSVDSDGFTDEKRPYEFGFNIEGQQHRHEKKDDKGIIMGEFGFITADGIYHVTVYATDENGDFKIISMKNIRVSPPLDGSAPYKPSLNLASTSRPTSIQPINTTPQVPKTTVKVQLGCSGCEVPITTPKNVISPQKLEQNDKISTTFSQLGKNPFQNTEDKRQEQKPIYDLGVTTGLITGPNSPLVSNNNLPVRQIGLTGELTPLSPSNVPQTVLISGNELSSQKPVNEGLQINTVNTSPSSPKIPLFSKQPLTLGIQSNNPSTGSVSNEGEDYTNKGVNSPKEPLLNTFGITKEPSSNLTPSQLENIPPFQTIGVSENNSNRLPGTSITGSPLFTNMPASLPPFSQDNKNIFSNNQQQKPNVNLEKLSGVMPFKNPGIVGVEKEGLPPGITKSDIMELLYKFNYTVGFHGHHENGYRNGDKVGGYFANARDGVGINVNYLANEFGYQPNITLVDLGLQSPYTPKEDTEKSFGLKGYEFKWFYRK
ncbi:unnamed protein product [Timema podura]|uniref:Uncharacterized protein n=1 Tax=Timema podura TaxID=61482 RepID=A0ABN7NNM2_TIMPD|nr:unnamed protein product [Timema podura]